MTEQMTEPVAALVAALNKSRSDGAYWWEGPRSHRSDGIPDWADEVVSSLAAFIQHEDEIELAARARTSTDPADLADDWAYVVVLATRVLLAQVESEDGVPGLVSARVIPFRSISSVVITSARSAYRTKRESGAARHDQTLQLFVSEGSSPVFHIGAVAHTREQRDEFNRVAMIIADGICA